MAVALGNLYHPNVIEIPGRLVAGILAISIQLNFKELHDAALKRMSHALNEKIIGDCFKCAIKVIFRLKFNNKFCMLKSSQSDLFLLLIATLKVTFSWRYF